MAYYKNPPAGLNVKTCKGCGCEFGPRGYESVKTWQAKVYCGRKCSELSVGTRSLTHGDTSRVRAPEYSIYRAMLNRCYNPKVQRYPCYGGRGIAVCDEWRGKGGYEAFLAHVGRRPNGAMSLDRIDGDDHYRPGNVRWATVQVQANNRSISRVLVIQGQEMTLAEAARRFNIKGPTIARRIKTGMTADQAVTAPLRGAS